LDTINNSLINTVPLGALIPPALGADANGLAIVNVGNARTLAQPANLKANQVSDASGTQIRLTWDYQNGSSIDGFEIERVPPSSFGSLSSPALSTGSELSVHPDLSVCQSSH